MGGEKNRGGGGCFGRRDVRRESQAESCAWEELLGLGGMDVQGGDDKNGIDPERTITATTTNGNGCKEVMIRMREDVKVLKEACAKYESLIEYS